MRSLIGLVMSLEPCKVTMLTLYVQQRRNAMRVITSYKTDPCYVCHKSNGRGSVTESRYEHRLETTVPICNVVSVTTIRMTTYRSIAIDSGLSIFGDLNGSLRELYLGRDISCIVLSHYCTCVCIQRE